MSARSRSRHSTAQLGVTDVNPEVLAGGSRAAYEGHARARSHGISRERPLEDVWRCRGGGVAYISEAVARARLVLRGGSVGCCFACAVVTPFSSLICIVRTSTTQTHTHTSSGLQPSGAFQASGLSCQSLPQGDQFTSGGSVVRGKRQPAPREEIPITRVLWP